MAKNVVLLNVKVFWAQVQQPSKMSGKYEVEVHNLTKQQKDTIMSWNPQKKPLWTNIRTNQDHPEKGEYIKFYAKNKPKLINGAKEDLPEGTLIGNGSLCNLQLSVTEPQDQKGVAKVKYGLQSVQVLKLESYVADVLPVVGEDSAGFEEVN